MYDLPFDEARFRQALGRFATGIAIVTAATPEGERLGLTVSSFNSVSLSPPLVLFSLARRTSNFPLWQAARHYAVNILGEDQEALSDRFARSLSDRWSGLDVVEGRHGTPLLAGAIAVFECEAYARYDGGDHEIFVGRVVDLRMAAASARPLVFFNGRYRGIDRAGEARPAPADTLAPQPAK